MSFLKDFIQRLRSDVGGLMEKLSIMQKGMMILIAALLSVTLMLIIQSNSSDDGDYATIRMNVNGVTTDQLTELQALLEENGMETRLHTVGQNNLALQVSRKKIAQARLIVAEKSAQGNLDWLFGKDGTSITDSPALMDKRFLESRKREVADTLSHFEKVSAARLHVEKKKASPFATQSNFNDTAAVVLTLSAGTDELSKKEAAMIRRLVAGAFNLRPQNIQLSDRRKHYPYVDSQNGMSLSDEQDRFKTEALLTLQQLYGKIFSPSEFVVGVIVDVSQERSKISNVEYDPEKLATSATEKTTTKETGTRQPGNPVGAGPNAGASVNPTGAVNGTSTAVSENEDREITRTVNEVRFSEKKTQTDIPAGQLLGVSVNLVLDRNAVLRVLAEDGSFTEEEPADAQQKPAWRQKQNDAINNFVQQHDGIVKAQFPYQTAQVTTKVSVVSFPKTPEPEEVAFAGSFSGWFSNYWKDVGLGVIALVGLLVFFAVLKRAVPAPIEIPSLEDSMLLEEDRVLQAEVQTLQSKIEDFTKEEDRFEQEVTENELNDTLGKIQTTAESRPEAVAAVLRTWMSGAATEDQIGPSESKSEEQS